MMELDMLEALAFDEEAYDAYLEERQKRGPWIEQICDPCARLLGGIAYECLTYNQSNPCDVCGKVGVPVTEPRDWRIDLPIAEARRRRDLVFAKAEECEGVWPWITR